MCRRVYAYTGFLCDTVKPVLSGHSKQTPKIGFEDPLSLNAGQKYCRMQNPMGAFCNTFDLQLEHSAILSTFNKQPFVIKTCVLSIFEWPLKTGFTVSTIISSERTLAGRNKFT